MNESVWDMKFSMEQIESLIRSKGYREEWINEFMIREFHNKGRKEVSLSEIVDHWFISF